MSIIPLLPSESDNSVIPVLAPQKISFYSTYVEVFWSENSLGELIQPQLLRIHAYCCDSLNDKGEPISELVYYLEYFVKKKYGRYILKAQGNAHTSEIFYIEWLAGRYVSYTGSVVICPPFASPFDTRITALEFEDTLDRWTSLSDEIVGVKQDFLPFQIDFDGCDALPIRCKDGPGWYSQITFNGDPLGNPVFLTIPSCIPFEDQELVEEIFDEFSNFILDSIIDLAPTLAGAAFTINPFVGSVVSILFDIIGDTVDIEMEFCPCPPGTECVPGCGCLPPCPEGYVREGCDCVSDEPDEDPPPEDFVPNPPLKNVVSPKKKIPDGPNNYYYDLPDFPMEASSEGDCVCALYKINYTTVTTPVGFRNGENGYEYVFYPMDTSSQAIKVYGELFAIDFLYHTRVNTGSDEAIGMEIFSLCRGVVYSGCVEFKWHGIGYHNTRQRLPRPPFPPLNNTPRFVSSIKIERDDGVSMEVCGWPKIIGPQGEDSCPDGTWYLVIELVSKRLLPLKGFRRIVSVPGNKCLRPTLAQGEGGFYFIDPSHLPLNITLSTLVFYSVRLVDAYFFE